MAKRTTVTSRKISHKPRVNRKRESAARDLLRRASDAPVPTSRKKTGAQKWVIQRVRKSPALACARLVGLISREPRKSRVWSSAIRIITIPRSKSTDSSRRGLMLPPTHHPLREFLQTESDLSHRG